MILSSGKNGIGHNRSLLPLPQTEKATKITKTFTVLKDERPMEAGNTGSTKIPGRRNDFKMI